MMQTKEIIRSSRSKENSVVVMTSGGKILNFSVIWVGPNRCKLRFEQDSNFTVYRKELLEKIKQQKNIVDVTIA